MWESLWVCHDRETLWVCFRDVFVFRHVSRLFCRIINLLAD